MEKVVTKNQLGSIEEMTMEEYTLKIERGMELTIVTEGKKDAKKEVKKTKKK